MWRKISSFGLHLFLWKDTHRHTTHSLLIIKMFSVTQTVTQSVRLNATVSKRDVTRRYEVLCVLCVFDRSSESEFCSFVSPLFVTRHFFHETNAVKARARRRSTSSFLSTPNTTRRESFFCSLLSSKRVKHGIFRDEIYNWKEWKRDITRVLNCPISVNTFLLQKRTRQQPSHAKRT